MPGRVLGARDALMAATPALLSGTVSGQPPRRVRALCVAANEIMTDAPRSVSQC